MQVDVFKVGGDTGPGARLDGVAVHVVQYVDGQVTEETLVTGAGGQPGQVTFALRGWAEVKLMADGVAGAASSTAFVRAIPAIPTTSSCSGGCIAATTPGARRWCRAGRVVGS